MCFSDILFANSERVYKKAEMCSSFIHYSSVILAPTYNFVLSLKNDISPKQIFLSRYPLFSNKSQESNNRAFSYALHFVFRIGELEFGFVFLQRTQYNRALHPPPYESIESIFRIPIQNNLLQLLVFMDFDA